MRIMCIILLVVSHVGYNHLDGVGEGAQCDIHVAGNGEDRPRCGGTPETPCQTLQGALKTARSGDIIRLDGYREGAFYRHCFNTPLHIPVSVTIVGYRGRPRIGCPRGHGYGPGHMNSQGNGQRQKDHEQGQSKDQGKGKEKDKIGNDPALLNITSVDESVINVTFSNVILVHCALIVCNTAVVFNEVAVHDSRILTPSGKPPGSLCRAIDILTHSSLFKGSMEKPCDQTAVGCQPSSVIDITAGYLKLQYKNTTFLQTSQTFRGRYAASAHISDCLVSNDMTQTPVHGGIYLTVDGGEPSTVVVEDSIFENQYHFDPVRSVMNLYEAPVMVRSIARLNSNASVYVRRNIFRNNERGLTVMADFREIIIADCIFQDNIAMHAGAGILFLNELYTLSNVTNCTFHSNAAGAFRAENIVHYKQSFQVQDGEVRIHSTCCKGVISFVGKGGGIRVQRGRASIVDCSFVNNTARLLGGAVFVDRECQITIENSYFENSAKHKHSMQGDLLYSDGTVQVKSARMLVQSSQNHVAMLRHSGDHWSIEVTEVEIQCPIGYRLRVTNTSAYGVNPHGLRRSYKMDQLSYFCESCPRNKYSLDNGYLNYSLVYSGLDYFTLLINGEKPTAAYNGSYLYHDIECLECPYGARCQEGITAVPNFWGYVHGNTIAFQHCPKGYCCSSMNCPTYNTCRRYRTGTLCGRCIDGYSEALFSPACVPDEECDVTWLWPFTIASGILYTLFLLFQKDVRDLMFTTSVSLKDLPVQMRRHSHVRYEMNSIIRNEEQAARSPLREPNELLADGTVMESELDADGHIENNNRNKLEAAAAGGSGGGAGADADNDASSKPAPAGDNGAGFLIILFYYFQDAQLLHIKTVFASADSRSKNMIKTILSGLFKFRIELFQFMDKVCFISNMAPSSKLLAKAVVVPYVILQFGVMYVVCRWCYAISSSIKSRSSTRSTRPSVEVGASSSGSAAGALSEAEAPAKKTFLTRLSQGFVLALLFTYQKLAATSLTLLNCVKVGNDSVLFIEGSIVCYEMWQWGIMAYTSACIAPFCLALLLGPGLLKQGLISLPQFFCACICPLPFLLYWLILRLRLHGQDPPGADQHQLSSEASAVIAILQGPFKESRCRFFGPTCGQGVLIGRRLVLVLLNTFVNDPLIRMLCMLLVCFIILLHHVHVLPYKDTKGNLAGSASAAALLIVGGVNLVRAGFEAAEYVPQGPNETLMLVFEEVENVLMLWFPLGVMSLIFLALSVKLMLIFLKCILTRNTLPLPAHVTENTHTESTTL